jgi:hypothetical protein
MHGPELEYGSEAGYPLEIRLDETDAHGSA